jgi:L-serine dehydratase
MAISVFDLFKIGIGPSSSHTVGPMKAARSFVSSLVQSSLLHRVTRVQASLYGSLGATGKGHGSDKAVLLGFSGYEPDTVDVDRIPAILEAIRVDSRLHLAQAHAIDFAEPRDLQFFRKALPLHANGRRFVAFDHTGEALREATFYSVGGGFVISEETGADGGGQREIAADATVLPLPFHSCEELLSLTRFHDITIAQVMRRNERHWRTDEEIDTGLLGIWRVMQVCVERGCRTEGVLPGALRVKRRAAALARSLNSADTGATDSLRMLDWVTLFALAVNEENAAGGRVVTAPTTGAAGIVPAVLHYYMRAIPGASERGVIDLLLTAAAIGMLYKENASISGAEVGCQGEVGVACSMAAGALCAVLGGRPEQVENAAENGMEHHLGLTSDPVGGLVQIPCIERYAIVSVTAINAARMALRGDGTHYVSPDKVIKTMRETGADLLTKYKETARGGLAVNTVEC